MVEESVVRDRLNEILKPEFLDVSDFSDGCGAKYNLIVVSDIFEGKKLIDRQRLVHDALSKEMASIHALTMKTYTPEQWKALQ